MYTNTGASIKAAGIILGTKKERTAAEAESICKRYQASATCTEQEQEMTDLVVTPQLVAKMAGMTQVLLGPSLLILIWSQNVIWLQDSGLQFITSHLSLSALDSILETFVYVSCTSIYPFLYHR